MSKMTKQQFIGHMFCDMRYKQLKDKIKYHSLDTVMELYTIHQSLTKSVRYNDLQKTFEERFKREHEK